MMMRLLSADETTFNWFPRFPCPLRRSFLAPGRWEGAIAIPGPVTRYPELPSFAQDYGNCPARHHCSRRAPEPLNLPQPAADAVPTRDSLARRYPSSLRTWVGSTRNTRRSGPIQARAHTAIMVAP
jgi:hypothetical protein